jgi:hypothetical protein
MSKPFSLEALAARVHAAQVAYRFYGTPIPRDVQQDYQRAFEAAQRLPQEARDAAQRFWSQELTRLETAYESAATVATERRSDEFFRSNTALVAGSENGLTEDQTRAVARGERVQRVVQAERKNGRGDVEMTTSIENYKPHDHESRRATLVAAFADHERAASSEPRSNSDEPLSDSILSEKGRAGDIARAFAAHESAAEQTQFNADRAAALAPSNPSA